MKVARTVLRRAASGNRCRLSDKSLLVGAILIETQPMKSGLSLNSRWNCCKTAKILGTKSKPFPVGKGFFYV
ncbi:hypothetical protein DR996_28800 [Vibrio owensii]|nr:hypothetical protein DR996_28800 [Vibrio owensii]